MGEELKRDAAGHVLFTRAMKKTHQLLLPAMLPIHFTMLEAIVEQAGYRPVLLKNDGHNVVEEGLKHVHNDTCYPALLVIGQIIDALKSGAYDLEHVAVCITQTGGGCRASNYFHLLRKAMVKAGYPDIPVLSLNISGLEKQNSVKLGISVLRKAISAVVYGDMLMLLKNQVMAYEDHPGDAEALTERWLSNLTEQITRRRGLDRASMRRNLHAIAADFAAIPVTRVKKVRVGVVGEIYVKYSALANNGLEAFLASEGCEVMVPGLMGFLFYCMYNATEDERLYGGQKPQAWIAEGLLRFLSGREDLIREALAPYPDFVAPSHYKHLAALTKDVIGLGAKMGEGWLLPAEMMELIEQGYGNIVCTQPFGCLPNHIVGKGVLSNIKRLRPEANIVAIDYDPSATKVNQENRIKLMLAVARERL